MRSRSCSRYPHVVRGKCWHPRLRLVERLYRADKPVKGKKQRLRTGKAVYRSTMRLCAKIDGPAKSARNVTRKDWMKK